MVPRLTETTSTHRDQIVEVLCMCELFGCKFFAQSEPGLQFYFYKVYAFGQLRQS